MAVTKDDDVWFEAKAFGLGIGKSVAWQGRAVRIGYIIAMIVLPIGLMPLHPVPYYVICVALTVAMLVVSARHTRGGLRWRGWPR